MNMLTSYKKPNVLAVVGAVVLHLSQPVNSTDLDPRRPTTLAEKTVRVSAGNEGKSNATVKSVDNQHSITVSQTRKVD